MTVTVVERSPEVAVSHGMRSNASASLEVTAVIVTAVVVWSARRIDVSRVGDLGLVAALPAAYWVALIALNGAFLVALHRRAPTRTMVVLFAALIVALFGVASIASPFPRGEAAWRHLGVIDHLVSSRRIDPDIDAYFNWTGFFALSAAGAELAGVRSLLGLARWAPLWINVIWATAASLPLRFLTPNRTTFWLAMWLFGLGNWIDQDYYSPQAFAYFFYLMIIGLTLWALAADVPGRLRVTLREGASRRAAARRWWNGASPHGAATARQRSGALLLVVLLAAGLVVTHQLTPVATLFAIAALAVTGRLWASRLPVILATVLVVWLLTGASGYLAGHPVLSFNQLEQAAGANLVERLAGSAGHLFVVRERMMLFGLMFVVAAAGAWRRALRDVDDSMRIVPALLVVAPFLLVPTQTYGGEMLLRATLFALPFAAVLAADALVPDGTIRGRSHLAVLTAVCSVWAAGCVTARYGNARFDMFTAHEVAAVEAMYELAPPDAVLISAAHPTPWRHRQYTNFANTTFEEICRTADGPDDCAHAVLARIGYGRQGTRAGGFVLVLRSGQQSLRMRGLMSSESIAHLQATLLADPDVELVYENPDARLYRVGDRV